MNIRALSYLKKILFRTLFLFFLLPGFTLFSFGQNPDGFKVMTWENPDGNWDESSQLEYFLKKEQEFLDKNDWVNAVRANLHQLEYYKKKSDRENRLLAGKAALTQMAKIDEGWMHLKGIVFQSVGDAFLGLGKYDSSIYYLNICKDINREKESWDTVALCNIGLSVNYFRKKDYDQMEFHLKEAESVLNQYSDKENNSYGIIFNLYGVLYRFNGDYDKALASIKRSLVFSKDNAEKVTSYNNLGVSFKDRGDYDRAEDNYRISLNLALNDSSIDPELILTSYNNLATLNYRKGSYEAMVSYLKKSFLLIDKTKNKNENLIEGYNNIALAYIEQDSFELAKNYLDELLKIQPENHKEIAKTYHNLSYLYRKQHIDDKAIFYLNKAIEKNEARFGGSHPDLAKENRHLGIIYERNGEKTKALSLYQKALGILVPEFSDPDFHANPPLVGISSRTEMLKCLRAKGNLLLNLSDGEAEKRAGYQELSLQTYELAISLLDTMENDYRNDSKAFWNQEVRPLYNKAVEVAINLFEISNDEIYLEKAFQFAEKSKAALLKEAIQTSNALKSSGIPEEIMQLEKDLKINISFYKQKVFKEKQKGPKAKNDQILLWENKIAINKNRFDSLLLSLEKEYSEYYHLKYARNEISIENIQSELNEDELLVEYVVGEKAIYIFGITQKSVVVKTLNDHQDFQNLVELFLNELKDRDLIIEKGLGLSLFTNYIEKSLSIFNQILKPVWNKTHTRLIIVPDSYLGYLPFEVLLTENYPDNGQIAYGDLPYLFKEQSIRYEYSASLLGRSEKKNNPSYSYLGFAPVYHEAQETQARDIISDCDIPQNGSFANLPNNEDEINQIYELLNGKVFSNRSAQESEFKSKASESQIVHLAMHGFLNDCDPMYSGLAFSKSQNDEDGFLYAYEIYNLRLNADLAVLSACNTGMGQLNKGEGIMSLARAFKYAGCPNIVMSLWQADDEITRNIMTSFYKFLKKGIPKDEALTLAKIDFLNQRYKAKHHPFYWAPFVLIGDSEAMKMKKPYNWFYLSLLILIPLFGYFTVKGYQLVKNKN